LLVKRHYKDGTIDIVLSDFDFVLEIDTAAHTTVGKTQYMAPEVSTDDYGTMADIWSAGVVLIELMTLSSDHKLNTMTESNEREMHDAIRKQMVRMRNSANK
jgi:serine/threonine protein kinase